MKVLESRKGHTSHNFNPWFAIDAGDAAEEHGRVWFGALAWSGNWRITVEQTPYRQVRVTGGLNTFRFRLSAQARRKPGHAAVLCRVFGERLRRRLRALLHRFEREEILPGGLTRRLRPVLYNSWEATTFNVNEAGQKELAEKAAKLGVELFVMDDGWFGKRNDDRAGLGDWTVNPQKFPQGLKAADRHVNGLGMDFGLWVEPEMVNADSDLYRAHPDWVINFPGRPRSELRNQMVLNLARSDVKEYIFGVLDKLATENNIRYFKWDMNRSFSEPGWPEAGAADQRKLWVQYVRNLYEIIDRLRAKTSEARNRILLGRRRARGFGDSAARGGGLGVGQYRGIRPAAHSGGLHAGLCAQGHVGVGDRRSEHEQRAARRWHTASWWPCRARSESAPT